MICSFYSFKGGVGRSMALANVAELLYNQGLRVLMIDFDLEAPGLERFFEVPEALHSPDEVMSARGIVDMLLSYKDLRSLPQPYLSRQAIFGGKLQDESPLPVEPLANFIVPIYEENTSGGYLAIVPAGSRGNGDFARYANQVRSFDWNDFYNNWNGEQFFEQFRREAEASFDVILIDSRTGVTEMGGVCNYQLADIVILFVAPNQQNIDGIVRIAYSLMDPKLIEEGRNGRTLSLVFVPSRIEHGEKALLDNFEKQFNHILNRFPTPQLTFEKSAFIDLKIPYVPYFAYTENVAVREASHASSSDLVTAFRNLMLALAKLAPKSHRLRTLLRNPAEQIEVVLRENAVVDHVHLFDVDALLEEIRDLLNSSKDSWIISLFGEGGIGKTALAYEAVSRYAAEAGFTRIAWVSAKTVQILPKGILLRSSDAELRWTNIIKKIADQLFLTLGDSSTGWLVDFQRSIRTLPSNEKCLIVIDNLETIEDTTEAIRYLCGSSPSNRIINPHKILITTRCSILGEAQYVVEKHLTGLSKQSALKFIRELGNEDIKNAGEGELMPIINATEGNPLLIKLVVTRFKMSHLPLEIVLRQLQKANELIGKNLIDYLYAESLAFLEQECGKDVAHSLINAFCPLGAGEPIDYHDLFKYSDIKDEVIFQKALSMACTISLIRVNEKSKYSIHNLLWRFVCDLDS